MEDTGPSTIEHGGMTITHVGQDVATVNASLEQGDGADAPEKAEKPAKRTISDSARDLGKRGGKAAAEKRAEAAKEAPEEKPPASVEAKAGQEGAAAEEPEGGEGAEEEKLSDRARRRIEVATRKQAEARRELEAERQARQAERTRYEAELAAHRVRGQGTARGDGDAESRSAAPQPHDSQWKPREEDFERFSDYLDARDQWNRKEWDGENQRRGHAERVVHTLKGHIDTFVKAANETPNLRDDIDPELLEIKPYFLMGPDEQVGPDNLLAAEVVYSGAKAPAILKHLTEHPDELQRLRALRTHEDIRVEVRVLAKTIGSQSDATAGEPPEKGDRAPKRETSKANPPVRPVTGAPHIADGDGGPRSGEDFDAWHARTTKRTAAQR